MAITRCSNNYGPYQFPEKVIPLFVTNLMDGATVPLYGEGRHVRDWLHVDDHCRGIALVLAGGRAGEIYNIGGGTELTNAELTAKLVEATGRDESFIERIVDPRGGGHDQRYSVEPRQDHRRARLPAAGAVRPGPGRHHRLVPGQPRLVGAAQGPLRDRPLSVSGHPFRAAGRRGARAARHRPGGWRPRRGHPGPGRRVAGAGHHRPRSQRCSAFAAGGRRRPGSGRW